jgi:hypothetical protein
MNFYWYHSGIFKCYFQAKFKNPSMTDHALGSDDYQKLHKINLCFSKNPWGMLHDITNHVEHPFNIITKTGYSYKNQTKTFGNICIETAEKILTMSDRAIAVFWSGGIDSTAALVAMLQTAPLDRITVVCNQASIDEFPSFYEHKIKNRVKIMSPTECIQNYNKFYIITGSGGDTVWGVIDESFWKDHQHNIHKHWKDVIDKTIIDDIDFVEEFCSWSNVDINDWVSLRTWFYLCCKWQDKCVHPYSYCNYFKEEDIVAFYDIDNTFQNWTVNNLDKIIGDTWHDYKIPAKEFIHQYHLDTDYLKTKSKVDSISLNYDLSSNYNSCLRIAVDEKFSSVHLPSLPFVDYAEIEDFNDTQMLIPSHLLTN